MSNDGLLKLAYETDAPDQYKIYYCRVGEKYPVHEFIDSLSDDEIESLMELFEFFCVEKGGIKNDTKFKKFDRINGELILEFKDYQVRIAGFYRDGGRFCLIHGFRKKTQTTEKKDIKSIKKNLRDYLKAEEKSKKVKK